MRAIPAMVLASLLASGCTTVWMSPERYREEVALALESHHYRRALELIGDLAPSEQHNAPPEWDVKSVMASAGDWRREVLAEAQQLAAAGQWAQGAQLLATADRQLPESQGFATERSAYAERQLDAARQRLLAYDLLRARHLAAERQALQEALASAPDPEPLAAAAARQASDREQLLSRLVPAADAALADSQWRAAMDIYSAVLALDPIPSDPLKQKRRQAEVQLASIHRRKQERAAEVHRQLIDQAIQRAGVAIVAEDYQRAGEILAQARAKAGDDERLAAEQNRLEQAVRGYVSARLEEGDRLYANGQIEAALRQWRQAEKLQPGASEIGERIHKAERFIERYRALKREG